MNYYYNGRYMIVPRRSASPDATLVFLLSLSLTLCLGLSALFFYKIYEKKIQSPPQKIFFMTAKQPTVARSPVIEWAQIKYAVLAQGVDEDTQRSFVVLRDINTNKINVVFEGQPLLKNGPQLVKVSEDRLLLRDAQHLLMVQLAK